MRPHSANAASAIAWTAAASVTEQRAARAALVAQRVAPQPVVTAQLQCLGRVGVFQRVDRARCKKQPARTLWRVVLRLNARCRALLGAIAAAARPGGGRDQLLPGCRLEAATDGRGVQPGVARGAERGGGAVQPPAAVAGQRGMPPGKPEVEIDRNREKQKENGAWSLT